MGAHVWSQRLVLLTAVLLFVVAGCGDPPLATGAAVDAGPDIWKQDVDAAPHDGSEADGSGDDASAADSDAGGTDLVDAGPDVPLQDGVFLLDTGPLPDIEDTASSDPCGTDKISDFHVVSTTPDNGEAGVANPFQFTVTFNAKVKAVVIGPNTVQVTVNGEVIDGSFSVKCNTFSFKAAQAVLPASRVDVTMSQLVQAEIGFSLPNQQGFHFYVKGFDGMAGYEKLARRYAPTVRHAVADGNAGVDKPRAFDFDGDWSAGNNGANAAKSPALPQVGWSVLETQSHFFITYVYFWPHRNAVLAGQAFDNDAAGATVAVARYPQEHPVAVTTWFKQKSEEEMWTWVTSESGIPKTGYVRGTYPEATLFPPAKDGWGCDGIAACVAKRFPAFVTSGNHQSCLWLDAGDSLNCTNNASTQQNLKWVDYLPGATPTEPGVAAAPGPTASYGLYSTYDAWWPRRQDTGSDGMWQDATFTYTPPLGRPAGVKMTIGGKLYNKDADASRPPWAWRWKGANYYDMPVGTPFLDPAYANAKRFEDTKKPLGEFDAVKKTGWSLDYCFNPYLYIDYRSTPNCQGSLP